MTSKLILALILALLSPFVVAESFSVSYNVFTYHHNSDTFSDDGVETLWNEKNKIVVIRLNTDENFGYFLGKGRNSYYENSILSGVEFSTDDDTLEIGSDIGLATGYEAIIDGGVVPFINPFIRVNYDLSYYLTLSLKVGSVNFTAENAFIELKKNF